ncbi:hypothetical protein EXIGLDRAFT_747728 [Exidia glandulosa HHB12029]|uniref:Uncharacterized protein n=1 Tax=Exidia glandulosa HHB12029 TaxID=1314781 RepID=A0A165KFE0_EXIGL|nr:hypothetical protein EXIGLDRAFT_747728 [Exidia glandulosa HHB12029]
MIFTTAISTLALAVFVSGAGINCNLDPLTITNWSTSVSTGPGGVTTTTITFDVTSPDAGTAPSSSCTGTVVGRNSVASGGDCTDGGSYTLQGPSGTLAVRLPRECPAGVEGTLTASGQVPTEQCTQTANGETCPPFQLEA